MTNMSIRREKREMVPGGEIFVITIGEYDEYDIFALGVAKAPLDFDSLQDLWIEETGQDALYFDPAHFWAWLVSKGLVRPIRFFEVWLSCAGIPKYEYQLKTRIEA